MCLTYYWPEKDKNEWLKDEPDTITAYKVVIKNRAAITVWPPFFNSLPYKKTNKIDIKTTPTTYASYGKTRDSSPVSEERRYKAGYHLFVTKYGTRQFIGERRMLDAVVLKCLIPKDQVIAVGKENDCMVIVTKEFTFIGGDQYFKEEKRCA